MPAADSFQMALSQKAGAASEWLWLLRTAMDVADTPEQAANGASYTPVLTDKQMHGDSVCQYSKDYLYVHLILRTIILMQNSHWLPIEGL